MDIQRIVLLKVPLDIVEPEELPELINSMRLPGGIHGSTPAASDNNARGRNIVLLSIWDLLRARRNDEYRNYILKADLVLPVSKSLVSGARFLTGKKLVRYMPFKFVISLLSILEQHEYPLYLLGGTSRVLKKAERNIHSTFPRLRIVGRREGSMHKQDEPIIIEAIRKASPSLLLAGKGIRGEELWIARHSDRLNSGFRLWCSDLFDVFAEKKHRPSDAIFERGLENIGICFRNPLKFFRFFLYLWYKILLVVNKLKH